MNTDHSVCEVLGTFSDEYLDYEYYFAVASPPLFCLGFLIIRNADNECSLFVRVMQRLPGSTTWESKGEVR